MFHVKVASDERLREDIRRSGVVGNHDLKDQKVKKKLQRNKSYKKDGVRSSDPDQEKKRANHDPSSLRARFKANACDLRGTKREAAELAWEQTSFPRNISISLDVVLLDAPLILTSESTAAMEPSLALRERRCGGGGAGYEIEMPCGPSVVPESGCTRVIFFRRVTPLLAGPGKIREDGGSFKKRTWKQVKK